MKSLRWSIAANFVGRAWTLIMGAVFVPIYLNLLGVEAYGLIGFFLSLQSVLGIVDLGLSLTLNRELARSQGSLRSSAAMVRTLETVYWSASVGVGAMLIACGGWIARSWVQTVSLPVETVTESVRAMGLIFSLQAPFALYQGGLVGLQKQVLANAVLIFTAAIRFGGAALALWMLSPTLRTYFSWHIASAIVSTGLCAWALWRFIPERFWLARAEPRVLRDIWKFSMTVGHHVIAFECFDLTPYRDFAEKNRALLNQVRLSCPRFDFLRVDGL
jgi:O-antigen/teichoic acid export membrane protein